MVELGNRLKRMSYLDNEMKILFLKKTSSGKGPCLVGEIYFCKLSEFALTTESALPHTFTYTKCKQPLREDTTRRLRQQALMMHIRMSIGVYRVLNIRHARHPCRLYDITAADNVKLS